MRLVHILNICWILHLYEALMKVSPYFAYFCIFRTYFNMFLHIYFLLIISIGAYKQNTYIYMHILHISICKILIDCRANFCDSEDDELSYTISPSQYQQQPPAVPRHADLDMRKLRHTVGAYMQNMQTNHQYISWYIYISISHWIPIAFIPIHDPEKIKRQTKGYECDSARTVRSYLETYSG